MRYQLSDFEWAALEPHAVSRANDRRVLTGIFWVRCSGAPWRDLPENYGPYTACCNRSARFRSGVPGRKPRPRVRRPNS
jgi:transposase